MTPRRLLVVFVTLAIVAAATFGAGWKWGSKGREGFGHERLAGWTWDAGVIQPAGHGNGHENDGDSSP